MFNLEVFPLARSPLVLHLLFCSFIFPIHGRLQNVTIDDTNGDVRAAFLPIYSGGGWLAVSSSNPCMDQCALKPDISKFMQQTYHYVESTGEEGNAPAPSVTLKFTGVAFWVCFTLVSGGPEHTSVHFLLDGQGPDQFVFDQSNPSDPNANRTFLYNAAIMQRQNLEDKEHTLVINSDQGKNNAVMFDYLIYSRTIPDESSATLFSGPTSTSSQSNSSRSVKGNTSISSPAQTSAPVNTDTSHHSKKLDSGTIAGIVAGGIVAFCIFCALIVYVFSRRFRFCLPSSSRSRSTRTRDDVNGRHGKRAEGKPSRWRISTFNLYASSSTSSSAVAILNQAPSSSSNNSTAMQAEMAAMREHITQLESRLNTREPAAPRLSPNPPPYVKARR